MKIIGGLLFASGVGVGIAWGVEYKKNHKSGYVPSTKQKKTEQMLMIAMIVLLSVGLLTLLASAFMGPSVEEQQSIQLARMQLAMSPQRRSVRRRKGKRSSAKRSASAKRSVRRSSKKSARRSSRRSSRRSRR